MPCDAGRNAEKLADLARRTGLHLVAPTGLHHDRFYGPAHWSQRVTVDELAELFAADVKDGIDANDYSGPVVRRTAHRAGVIKIAGSDGGPSERDRRVFAAAAEAHRRTGVPILTHCEDGTGALEQVRLLDGRWASSRRTSRSATSTRSSTAATTASCCRAGRSPSTTSRSAGATGRTARSSCSTG